MIVFLTFNKFKISVLWFVKLKTFGYDILILLYDNTFTFPDNIVKQIIHKSLTCILMQSVSKQQLVNN